MCVALYIPVGASVETEELERCAVSNDDAFGLCYPVSSGLKVWHTVSDKDFGLFVDQVLARAGRVPLLAHFRLATHGDKTVANAQPVWIHENRMALVHNGILEGYGDSITSKGNRSDTVHFCQSVLRNLPARWNRNPAVYRLIASALGSYNRIAVMDSHARVVTWGGTVDRGVWWSNCQYKPYKVINNPYKGPEYAGTDWRSTFYRGARDSNQYYLGALIEQAASEPYAICWDCFDEARKLLEVDRLEELPGFSWYRGDMPDSNPDAPLDCFFCNSPMDWAYGDAYEIADTQTEKVTTF